MIRYKLMRLAVIVGVIVIVSMMIGGCAVDREFSRPEFSEVTVQEELIAGSRRSDDLGLNDVEQGLPKINTDEFIDVVIPQFDYSGNVQNLCATLAVYSDADFIFSDLLVDEHKGSDEVQSNDVNVSYSGGYIKDLIEVLASVGISIRYFNNSIGKAVLVCGNVDDFDIVSDLFLPIGQLEALLSNVIIKEIGDIYIIIGTQASVTRALEVITALKNTQLPRTSSVYHVDLSVNIALLDTWLKHSQLTGEYLLIGHVIIGKSYVISAVKRYIGIEAIEIECVSVFWNIRSVNVEDVLSVLNFLYDAENYCGGGGSGGSGLSSQLSSEGNVSNYADQDTSSLGQLQQRSGDAVTVINSRGVLIAKVPRTYLASWYSAIERADPAEQSIIVNWYFLNLSQELLKSLGIIFQQFVGSNIATITSGVSIPLSLAELSSRLNVIFSKSGSVNEIFVSVQGVLGEPVGYSSTRTVQLSTSAIVADGIVTDSVERVTLGLVIDSEVVKKRGGFGVRYAFSLSSPSVAGSYASLDREGEVYVPQGKSVVLLKSLESSSGDALALFSVSANQSIGDVLVLIEVKPGIAVQ